MGEIDEMVRRQKREEQQILAREDAQFGAEVSLLSAIALEAQRIAIDPIYPCEHLDHLREAYLAVAPPLYMDIGADLP